MAEVDPCTLAFPGPELDEIFHDHIKKIGAHVGQLPDMQVGPVLLRGEPRWSAVWFIDGHNNGFGITMIAPSHIQLQFWSHGGDVASITVRCTTIPAIKLVLDQLMPYPAADQTVPGTANTPAASA